MSPQPEIAHYRITGKLGEGGMGAVYRATDTKLNRDVAIKVLPDAFAQDPDRMARFTREAQVLASLNHPNIAAIYGVEERALVLELVEGGTLEERIAQGAIPTSEALPLIYQLIDALEYAHEKGIVHRDLKPANLKLTPDGRLKVLDFGLARAMSNEPAGDPKASPTLTMRATMAGIIMGTAGYMAPEQARGHEADKRSDIWAFGAVVYEMLTGQQVFAGPTISDSLAAVLTRDPDFDGLAPELRKLVRLCLVRDVKQRLRDIGDARIAIADGVPLAAAQLPTPAAPAPRARLPWIVAGVCAICALALAGLWLRRPAEEPVAVKFTVPPPDKAAFALGAPEVSPDGRRIAFVGRVDEKNQLWVRDLDSTTARLLTGTEAIGAAASGFWSPDSRSLGFVAGGRLKRIDASGGPAITLCNIDSPRSGGGTWSRQGVILFNASPRAGLMRVPAAGGTCVPATELDSARNETAHRWPTFLPDGRHFLYLGVSGDQEKTAVWVGDLESKTRRLVISVPSNAVYDPRGYIMFLRENTLMAQPFDAGRLETTGDAFPIAEQVDFTPGATLGHFSVSETGVLAFFSGGSTGRQQLTWLDRAGTPLGTVGPPGVMWKPSISPDGRTVAVDRSGAQPGAFDIWLHDLVHGADTRFTFDAKTEWYPLWSPDGKQIIFASNRTGKWGLYVKPSSGTGQEELLFESPNSKWGCDWSRDGKTVFFVDAGAQSRFDLWALPNPLSDAASRKPYPLLATDANESFGALSPNGKYLAYMSDESGALQVYVQSFPGKEGKFQISASGGGRPVWSRDGKEIFYIAADQKLMAVEVKNGPGFEYGIPKPLFETRVRGGSAFDVSPDGKRFLMVNNLADSGAASLNVVLNWHAAVKK